MKLESYVFARRSVGVEWHLQGRLTELLCEAHRQNCLNDGWDVTPIQKVEVEVDTSLYAAAEDHESKPQAGCAEPV